MDNQSPLLAAIRAGKIDDLLLLLAAGSSPDLALAEDGETPLMCAAELGQVEAAGALLKAGADANRPDHFGLTALCQAASNGSDEALARLPRQSIR